jgi:hypothetical protein
LFCLNCKTGWLSSLFWFFLTCIGVKYEYLKADKFLAWILLKIHARRIPSWIWIIILSLDSDIDSIHA